MGQRPVETQSLRVPCGEGFIIGDLLRKYATRSVGSWQVAGYKIDTQSPNFGFSDGAMVSYLELLKGTVLCCTEQDPSEPKICRFVWNGECFVFGSFEIHGLNRGVGDNIVACLVYARGARTAEQNFNSIRDATEDGAEGFFAVPSSHSVVNVFRYDVKPIDNNFEWLNIVADKGVAERAFQSAVKTLGGLDI